jgi:hypothetical protein
LLRYALVTNRFHRISGAHNWASKGVDFFTHATSTKQPVNEWIKVSGELFYVLKTAKEIYQQTDGYFDPGIGHLVDVWGFGAFNTTAIKQNSP